MADEGPDIAGPKAQAKEEMAVEIRHLVAEQHQWRGAPELALKMTDQSVDALTGGGDSQRLADHGAVGGSYNFGKRAPDQFRRFGADQGADGASRKHDTTIPIKLEQQVGGGKRERNEPVPVMAKFAKGVAPRFCYDVACHALPARLE